MSTPAVGRNQWQGSTHSETDRSGIQKGESPMRIRSLLAAASAAVLFCALSVPASAHHSFAAEFDATQLLTLKGTLTKFERVNPHGWMYIDMKNQDGTVTNWAVETGAPTVLAHIRDGLHFSSVYSDLRKIRLL
jgi:hypothetical protein